MPGGRIYELGEREEKSESSAGRVGAERRIEAKRVAQEPLAWFRYASLLNRRSLPQDLHTPVPGTSVELSGPTPRAICRTLLGVKSWGKVPGTLRALRSAEANPVLFPGCIHQLRVGEEVNSRHRQSFGRIQQAGVPFRGNRSSAELR